ncbi:Oligopeptidase F [Clostridium carboxidivorans P7]|uniref:Oligopeptidase F n=1 Tax=Clostridium carboxidivorans P7 TaxID=536227 RepID=C6PSK7_9CLOT|nr:Oligopeptidase F [Clostridium carboxidivorans P7]
MAQIKKRDEISQQDKWKVEKIYENVESWEKDFEKLKSMAPKLNEYAGKLSKGEKLLEYFKLDEEVSRLAGKLAIFAHMKSDEDTANPAFQVLRDKIYAYSAEIQSMGAFFIPEILSLKEGTIDKFIEDIPELNMYKFLLEEILKKKPHVLSVEQEELIASVSDCLNAPEKVYSMLSNADMTFPKIKRMKRVKVLNLLM